MPLRQLVYRRLRELLEMDPESRVNYKPRALHFRPHRRLSWRGGPLLEALGEIVLACRARGLPRTPGDRRPGDQRPARRRLLHDGLPRRRGCARASAPLAGGSPPSPPDRLSRNPLVISQRRATLLQPVADCPDYFRVGRLPRKSQKLEKHVRRNPGEPPAASRAGVAAPPRLPRSACAAGEPLRPARP